MEGVVVCRVLFFFGIGTMLLELWYDNYYYINEQFVLYWFFFLVLYYSLITAI